MPADLDGSNQPPSGAPNPFTEIGTNPTWKLWRFHVDFGTPGTSTFTLPAPHPDAVHRPRVRKRWRLRTSGGNRRHAGHARRPRACSEIAYRRFADGHEALVGNLTVDSNGVAGIRWYEINNATSGSPGFAQQSTYQPNSTWRWMGALRWTPWATLPSASALRPRASSRRSATRAGWRAIPANTLAQGEATLFSGTGSQTNTVESLGRLLATSRSTPRRLHVLVHERVLRNDQLVQLENPDRELQVPELRAGPHGTLAGTVTNASTNNPVAGANVGTPSAARHRRERPYSLALPPEPMRHLLDLRLRDDVENSVLITGGKTTTENVASAVALGDAERKRDGRLWSRLAAVRSDRRSRQAGRAAVHRSDHRPLHHETTGERDVRVRTHRSCPATRSPRQRRHRRYRRHPQRPCKSPRTARHPAIRWMPPSESRSPATPSRRRAGRSRTARQRPRLAAERPREPAEPDGRHRQLRGHQLDFYGSGDTQNTPWSPRRSTCPPVGAVPDVPQRLHGLAVLRADRRRRRQLERWHDLDKRLAPRGRLRSGTRLETVQLPTAANQANVKVRFHFTSTFGFWWMVDDISVLESCSCVKVTGGLVEGNVSDLTTGAGSTKPR